MNKDQLRELYDYTEWANARVRDSANRLTDEEFTRTLSQANQSVRDTIAHILAGEMIWLLRWKGIKPTRYPEPADYPTMRELETRWAEVEKDRARFIETLDDDLLGQEITYQNQRGDQSSVQLGRLMRHVANHSSYHRGQVATLLRQLGRQPESTDLLLFFEFRKS